MAFKYIRRAGIGTAMALLAGATLGKAAQLDIESGLETETISAERLAELVIAANPGLAAMHAAAESATFDIEMAGSLDDPMVSYAAAPRTANSGRGLQQILDVSQKFPWPGTLAARGAAARYDAVAADLDVDALRLQVIAQAKMAYAEWRYVDTAIGIHHNTQVLLDDLLATAETRYAAGRASKQDVLQAEVEHTDLDNHLLQLLRVKTTIKARINALLNRAPEAPLPAAEPIDVQTDLPPFEKLREMALAQHPDLARLDARVDASESRITLSEKAFYPDFQVGVGYNGMWDNPDERPMVGVSINVPLNRSKRRADLDRARAEKRRADWSLLERRAELLADLAEAHAEVHESQASFALHVNELLPLATEYLEAAVADYQSGSGAFLNVITAEQRVLDTQLAVARARADFAGRLAMLERWAGAPLDAGATTYSGER